MAKKAKRQKPAQPAQKRSRTIPPVVFDALIVVLAIACFWPLATYYFAQDDFVFLDRANHGIAAAMGPFFSMHPGQFRPLTKGLYFLLTWPVLGLHPVPYHVLSILLHAVNAILVGVLLRRMGLSTLVSRLVAVLFAVNVGYMEAVGWISCVQQLISNIFLLLTLIFGIDALGDGGRRTRALATVMYLLALTSYEQTLAAPLVLLLWQWSRRGLRAAVAAAWGPLRVPLGILVAYALFMFAGKGMPDSGPYAMHLGKNVFDNLRTYTGLAFSLWLVFPAYGLPTGLTVSHGVWFALAAVHLVRGTFRDLAFGVGAFLLLLAPVAFTKDHTHSFHLYVPAIGAWFLLASALDGIRAAIAAPARRQLDLALVVALIIGVAGSTVALRKNVHAMISESMQLPRSFVLRRAVLAERMCHDLLIKSAKKGKGGRLILAYPYPKYAANWRNIYSALGQGSAVRLVLESPDLDVVFVPPAAAPSADDLSTEVLFYTELGRCYTVAEREEGLRRRTLHESEPAVAAPDSTGAGAPGH